MFKSRTIRIFIIIFCPLFLVFFDANAVESNPPVRLLILSAGEIGVDPDDDLDNPDIYGIDYRMLPFSKWNLIPAIGYFYKDGGARYLYTELRYDYWLSKNWVLVPSYGVGYYDKDDELDLGGEFEARAGLEISHSFDNNYRLGLVFFHLSHGSLNGSKNPGTEAVTLSISIPLDD